MSANQATRERETPTSGDGADDKSIRENASAIASKAGAAAQDALASGADAGLSRAAGGIESAAEKVREKADDASGVQAQVTGKAADAMEKAASYLKDHDSEELWDELTGMVKRHPVQAAMGALLAGYVIGKLAR